VSADKEGFPRAEEALRLLAAAVGSARLYPRSSALPAEAAQRFTSRANELSASGPLRFVVDPHGFRVGNAEVAPGQSQVVALAETLHSLQVGQLVVVPGVLEAETHAFVDVANTDPQEVRTSGGARASLVGAGVRHIAVIEVSLRASEEEGLLGLDPTTAPLDELAAEVANAAERRAQAAAEGPAGDEVSDAIERLEDATRELAMERMATAMMRLDETTRMRVLGLALKADTEGHRMEGMLGVIARMKPAALARLFTLVAAQVGTDPSRIAAAVQLPPETAKLLAFMLAPTPNADPDFGVSTTQQAQHLAEIMSTEDDSSDIDRQVSVASPTLSAARALSTATAVSRTRVDAETVRAIGDVLPQATRDGSFTQVREALRRLDEIATDPSLTDAANAARATLAEPTILADVCRVSFSDADAAIAGEILHAAGTTGAEVLLENYVHMGEPRRSLLRPVLRGMSEGVLGVARQRLRTAEPALAVAILDVLSTLGDKRAVPVVAGMLASLDEQVRFAAVRALATMKSPEAAQALIRVLNHREPETQRYAVREIGRARVAAAVPALTRALEDINVFARTYETRKEIIRSLEQIGTPEAEKALRGFAGRTLGLGRKTRELRHRAIAAADGLAKN
jgi:HEAT repeat protein